MLHGYSQNGATFQRKLRRLVERLRKTYPGAELIWPEGPILLDPSDVPGCDLAYEHERHLVDGPELRAWFDLRYVQNPPSGLMHSLDMLAGVLQRDGPFDGVIAFSQGTVMAALLASLLQGQARYDAFSRALQTKANVMPYPEAFLKLQHPPFKFGVLYAGRVGMGSYYDWLYNDPPIDTPFCHFVGKWDPMVDPEERDRVLRTLSAGHGSKTIVHNGGHFVPVDDASTAHVVEFIAKTVSYRGIMNGGPEAVKDAKYHTARKGMRKRKDSRLGMVAVNGLVQKLVA